MSEKDQEKTNDPAEPVHHENQERPTNEFDQAVKGTSLTRDAWRRLRKNKMAVAGLVLVIVYACLSLAAGVIPEKHNPFYSYKKIILDHAHLPPSLTKTAGELMLEKKERELRLMAERDGRETLTQEEKAELTAMEEKVATETMEWRGKTVLKHSRRYIFGTDYHGRDMLARIVYGGQISILIGIIGTLTAVVIGVIMGSLSGYLGGKADFIIMRVVDVMYGLPYMLLVIILMALLGSSFINLFVALSLVSWLTVARVVRGQIISLKNSEFVEAARSMGAGTLRIVFIHLVTNILGVIIVFATLRVPQFIMMESFLSFLGLGISAPFASWGSLVGDAVEGMRSYPWRLFFPAVAMTLFLFAMNFLGDGLRDAFDPQSKNRV